MKIESKGGRIYSDFALFSRLKSGNAQKNIIIKSKKPYSKVLEYREILLPEHFLYMVQKSGEVLCFKLMATHRPLLLRNCRVQLFSIFGAAKM